MRLTETTLDIVKNFLVTHIETYLDEIRVETGEEHYHL